MSRPSADVLPLRILIAGPLPAVAVALADLLEQRVGFCVEISLTFDGAQALALARERTFEVALLSTALRAVTSEDLAACLRQSSDSRRLPFIVLLAADRQILQRALETKLYDKVLLQPISMMDILQCVRGQSRLG